MIPPADPLGLPVAWRTELQDTPWTRDVVASADVELRARLDGAGKKRGGLRRPTRMLSRAAYAWTVIFGMVELHTS